MQNVQKVLGFFLCHYERLLVAGFDKCKEKQEFAAINKLDGKHESLF